MSLLDGWELSGSTDRTDVCLCWTSPDRQEITIFHRDGGAPEIDYASGRQIGTGTLADALRAVRLCREAMERYGALCGYRGSQWLACPDNRDGGSAARRRFISRFFREITLGEDA